MRVRPEILAIAVFMAAPVQAQQVELMHFEGAPQSIVLNVGQQPARSSMEAQVRPLDDVLVADFEHLGSQDDDFLEDTLVPVSQIDVPGWMRTGIAGSGSNASFLISATGGSCAAPAYRPRRDISFSAERRRAQLYPLISAVRLRAQTPGRPVRLAYRSGKSLPIECAFGCRGHRPCPTHARHRPLSRGVEPLGSGSEPSRWGQVSAGAAERVRARGPGFGSV